MLDNNLVYEMKPKRELETPSSNPPDNNREDTYKKVTWDSIYNPPPSPGPSGLS